MSSIIFGSLQNIFGLEVNFMLFKKTVLKADGDSNVLLTNSESIIPGGERAFRLHQHTEFEIALVKSGSGRYIIKEKEYDFAAGDIFIISSQELHCITRIDKGETFHLMNIQFEPRFIWSADNRWFDSGLLQVFFERNEIFENKLSPSNPATEVIRSTLLTMEKEATDQREQYALMVRMELIRVLITIMRSYDYVKNTKAHFDVEKQSLYGLERAINHINQNLENPLTLDELAKEANMNRSYFCTIFKKLNGISPWDYITIKRIEKAVGLLKSTNLTMLEIALNCGFNNTANFNRAFKKVKGRVPGSYRNK